MDKKACNDSRQLNGMPSPCSDMNCTGSAYKKYLHMCAKDLSDLGIDTMENDLNNFADHLSQLQSIQCVRDLQDLESPTSDYEQKCLTLRVLTSLMDWLRKCF